MTDPALVEKEALKMTEAQRALLADKLIQSITHVSDELRAQWVSESKERLAAYERGELPAVEAAEALNEARRRINQ